MKKVLLFIVIGMGSLLLIAFLAKDQIIKAVAPSITSSVLGVPVTLGDFSLDISHSTLKIKDLRVGSPEGFAQEAMLDLASLEVQYDLKAILAHQYFFKLINADIRKIVLAKNDKGNMNVQMLKPVRQQSQEVNQEPAATDSNAKPDINLHIDTLTINIDKLSMKDYKTNPPSIENFNLGFHHRTFTGIKSVNELTLKVIASQASITTLTNTAFMASHKVKKGIGFLFDTTTGVVGGAGGLLKNIANKL